MVTSCSDVCQEIIWKLLAARLPVSTEDEDSHDDVLEALANSVFIPRHFHVPDDAHYRDLVLPADRQVDMEEKIAGIILDFEKTEGNTPLYEEHCSELGRRLFRAIAADLRPDFFDKVEVELE